jgi:hypothetical protein
MLILLSNTILLFVSWLTTAYNCLIMTICKSILAILVLLTNSKVVTIVSTLGGILFNKLFLPSTITVVVIVLYSKVSSIYISI